MLPKLAISASKLIKACGSKAEVPAAKAKARSDANQGKLSKPAKISQRESYQRPVYSCLPKRLTGPLTTVVAGNASGTVRGTACLPARCLSQCSWNLEAQHWCNDTQPDDDDDTQHVLRLIAVSASGGMEIDGKPAWLCHKEKGDQAFRIGQFTMAAAEYSHAINLYRGGVLADRAKLFANRALSFQRAGLHYSLCAKCDHKIARCIGTAAS